MTEPRPDAADLAGIDEARAAARRARAPAAERCGALAVTADGGRHPGTTIRLAGAAGLSACAEQIALSAARAAGASPIARLYLWVPAAAGAHPCGRCLQLWRELAPQARCLLQRGDAPPTELDLAALLPEPFTSYPSAAPPASDPGAGDPPPRAAGGA
ncbi:MAG: hypothetical protein FJY75_00810 [Candidatus Eisenbacteria bacterium]|uniref:CMP/dCMP-type deaminase domain-containing protein n=1 Tax=Eiseniibacteriota bacterium TaxID=2212470 RepID=A0A937X8C2_UNCEI|nr:hypothetical protein [Candidatus Eisenbacteria bacterium]